MGRIKTQIVKRYAKLLLEKFPDKFTDDFESNKRVLMEHTEIKSVKLRNQLAGLHYPTDDKENQREGNSREGRGCSAGNSAYNGN